MCQKFKKKIEFLPVTFGHYVPESGSALDPDLPIRNADSKHWS
jgi:hypothetical protein